MLAYYLFCLGVPDSGGSSGFRARPEGIEVTSFPRSDLSLRGVATPLPLRDQHIYKNIPVLSGCFFVGIIFFSIDNDQACMDHFFLLLDTVLGRQSFW